MSTKVLTLDTNLDMQPDEPVVDGIFKQYERVIIESLITSFGLDFMIKDQHGGDVDTIHNVRQIGTDSEMTYKNKKNETAYNNKGEYNSAEYHQDSRYIQKNRQVKEDKVAGKLKDSYTNEKIQRNQKTDLDHTISAKEIHEDRGRVLSGLKGTDLANSDENLNVTNPHTNRTKKADPMDKFLEKHGDEYTDEQKATMREKDSIARKSYEAKLAKAYYTSPQFIKDTAKSSAVLSVKMGAKQVIGFIFSEMWFACKDEFDKVNKFGAASFADFIKALGRGIKIGFQNAKSKYKELIQKFIDGSVAGALSSLTTTLCNIFFTTAKNFVKIIRHTYASLVQAAKVLILNPDNYTFGERIRATMKILSTGASVVVGVAVSEAIDATPIGKIPVLGEIIQTFCGTLVSGILSCTLLYYLDRSEIMNKLFNFLDNIHSIETEIDYFKRQAEYFEQYAAELMQIDLEAFKKEEAMYSAVAEKIENATTEKELNTVLKDAVKTLGINIPWGDQDFDSFMKDKNSTLRFS